MNQKQGCLLKILHMIGLSPVPSMPKNERLELLFRLRDDYLSPAELSFYHVLKNTVGEQFVVCPKVNLADIFHVANPNVNFAEYNRINRKHLDFLLCEPDSMRPIVGIELDDRSHALAKRRARDEFVNALFDAAGLPLLRIPVQSGYNLYQLASQLAPYLAAGEQTNHPAHATPSGQNSAPDLRQISNNGVAAPLCPKCGVPMALRVVKRGQGKGERFYGCTNFPKCRQSLPFSNRAVENNGLPLKFQWPQDKSKSGNGF